MAVVVTKKGVQVKANSKYHGLGETISGLSEIEEKRLVEGGICEYIRPSFIPRDSSPDIHVSENPEKKTKPLETRVRKANKDRTTSTEDSESGPDTSHPLV